MEQQKAMATAEDTDTDTEEDMDSQEHTTTEANIHPTRDLEAQEHTTTEANIHGTERCSGENNIFICCLWVARGCLEQWTPIMATFFIYWLVYRPDRVHPRTDSAVLAAFDLNNTSLQYDLAVDLSFRNSRVRSIRYLDIAASVFYNGIRLGPTDDALPSFIQVGKNTTMLHPAFHGMVTVDSGVAAELQRERAAGIVHLRITVSLTLMYKVLFVKDVFYYKYDCWLWFPAPRNHTPALFHGNENMCWPARD